MAPSTANIRAPPTKEDRTDVKRMKKASSEVSDFIKSKFYPGLFDQENRDSIRKYVASSKPYPHCKIDKLVNDDLLRRVQKEIFTHLNFTTKETDIYKVNQTGDLANMDGLGEEERQKLASLFELRNAIYSKEFREFVSEVTGCGPLSPSKMDMSVNTYTAGCHLLNHDDVIGTRRVSFILYMPGDPDEHWDPAFGGALELYPTIEPDTPAPEPSVSVPPQWNSFAMFTVLPGYSFHSVEEVVVENKPRLSIQGWFHFPQEGEFGYKKDAEKIKGYSTQKQVEEPKDDGKDFVNYTNELDDTALLGLSEEDLKELATWINPVYLNAKYMKQITDKFVDDSAVQMKEFLKEELYAKIKAATYNADKKDNFLKPEMPPHGSGVRGDWYVQGPPVYQRFLTLTEDVKSDEETSVLFKDLRDKFQSESFRRWLAVLSQLSPRGYRGDARRFRPGHDYTLAKINLRGQPILDVTLSMATTPDVDAAEKWESCEYGGYECYMAAPEGGEDPATYRQTADEDAALLTLGAGANELSIVMKDEGVLRFVKYVSARAPGSRWDVAYEYDLPNDKEESA
ncbi:Oxoglutarate and iron-dependent oxygenase degradation C-term-domain-containing protein [Mycotypha africana]|uniref:Oxoglutarate and iron-dependent oxygenase degradation C-term-domain-containing protein n=1 Tax=Mycotypha africana TaxID=64632 RepID=UPI0023016BEF|nr:Oxoglutarate and iron-dependent oxygenase degradation C-term-domain-containing protein [Mycotypha africana]KAI8977202.1 Oxoglutarate and iron-dependent oxygenase degradation C-term-domain-containing protein [Mycotypha africana]